MALYLGRDNQEEGSNSNIRSLVENCARNDDITPLVKLVFEAQALADAPSTIAADGQQMVAIICNALRAVAADQDVTINDICHSHATAIAQTVGELEGVHHAVDEVKGTLVSANGSVQEAGKALVNNVQAGNQLTSILENLGQAAAAVQAAQGVLEQCLVAGQLIDDHQLYPALCMLDKIRRKHLAALLIMLTNSSRQGSSGGGRSTGGGGGPSASNSRIRSSKGDLEQLQLLHSFFSRLVDDMAASVQRLALQDFNQWLVWMRSDAREVGMKAIQAAAVERSLEGDLAGERKAILAALTGPARKSVAEIAAELFQAPFRQELLKEATSSQDNGDDSTDAPTDAPDVERSHSSISMLGPLLRRPSKKYALPTAVQQQLRDQRDLQQQQHQQQLASAVPAELPDLQQLFPGEPSAAIHALVHRQRRISHSKPGGAAGASSRLRQQQDQQRKPVNSLLELDMSGLHTAVHVAQSLGQLEDFRQHYLMQRRLQITADLQAPQDFLASYQAFLAQVTGFFVMESFVQRNAPELVGPAEGALLWSSALHSLKATLESAFDQLGSAPLMLMVKDFAVLVCIALERAGYQVAPMTEILLAARGRYHDLLASRLQQQLTATVEADVLCELEVRTEAQHLQLVQDLGLPWLLEGATPAGGRRMQLSPAGVPPLPYIAPFTCSVPEVLELCRQFVVDSLAFLRGLYSPWELLTAVFHQRDRMLSKVLVEVLSARGASVSNAEMLRESMKCAANAWALTAALDAFDDWTINQARPTYTPVPPQQQQAPPAPAASSAKQQGSAAAAAAEAKAAASKLTRARNRKAVLASGALSSTVQAALRALQDVGERDVVKSLAERIEQLLAGSRKGDWIPPEPLPPTHSDWVTALLSYLQETFDAGTRLLPRPMLMSIMRKALRVTATAAMKAFGPDGVKAFNLYAIDRLATNLAAIERFATRWGVESLADELAEPTQFCKLLLSGKVDDILALEVRQRRYKSLELPLVAAALDRFKEVPQQAKQQPGWATKKAVEAAAKQLRVQLTSGGAA